MNARLAAGLLLLVLLTVGVVAFTHHRCRLGGDAEVLLRRGLSASHGYVSANWQAWKTGGPHQSLKVEGGFPAVVALLSNLHLRLPFLINVLVWPGLFGLWFLWCRRTETAALGAAWSTALLAAGLLSLPSLLNDFALMSQPFRDPLALALALGASILLAHPSPASCLGAGALFGLSAWTRLPMAALIPVAGLYLFCLPGTMKDRLFRLLFLGAGLAAGLVPLLGQNILEGRVPWMPPSGQALLLNATPLNYDASLRMGWHPLNLARLLPEYAALFALQLPWWIHALAVAAVALGARRRRTAAPEVWLYASALALVIFYGGYHRVIPRYLFCSLWLTTGLAALGAARLLSLAAKKIPSAHVVISILLGLGVATAALRAADSSGAARAEWREARAFQSWLNQHTPDGARILTFDYPLQLWINLFGQTRDVQALSWGKPAEHAGRDLNLDALRKKDHVLFWANLLDPHGRPQASWWEDALRHHYALLEPPLLFVPEEQAHPPIAFWRLGEWAENPQSGTLPPRPSGEAWLILGLRDEEPSTAEMKFLGPGAPGAHIPATPGLHLIPWGGADTDAHKPLRWESTAPLGAPYRAEWHNPHTPMIVDFTAYELAPTHSRWFEPVQFKWMGYKNAGRDWGGYGLEKWRSWAHFLLATQTVVRLPILHGQAAHPGGQLILVYTVAGPTPESLKALAPIHYAIGGTPVAFTAEASGRPGTFQGLYFAAVRHTLPLPTEGSLAIESPDALPFGDGGVILQRMEIHLPQTPPGGP